MDLGDFTPEEYIIKSGTKIEDGIHLLRVFSVEQAVNDWGSQLVFTFDYEQIDVEWQVSTRCWHTCEGADWCENAAKRGRSDVGEIALACGHKGGRLNTSMLHGKLIKGRVESIWNKAKAKAYRSVTGWYPSDADVEYVPSYAKANETVPRVGIKNNDDFGAFANVGDKVVSLKQSEPRGADGNYPAAKLGEDDLPF